jgi:hypothetical protein
MISYATDLSKFVGFDGTSWKEFATSADIGPSSIPVKYEKIIGATDLANGYIDLPSSILYASTEDVEVVGAPDAFRETVDYNVVTANRIDWNIAGSPLLANLAENDVIVVKYERQP